jgi:hypothetical protein
MRKDFDSLLSSCTGGSHHAWANEFHLGERDVIRPYFPRNVAL